MFIRDILQKPSVTISFEVFPPKKADGFESVRDAALSIASLKPDFMSVTYGAGGTTAGLTFELSEAIQNQAGIPTLAHLTCVSSTREKVDNILEEYKKRGIQNVLALRGDIPPTGRTSFDSLIMRKIWFVISVRTVICVSAAPVIRKVISSVLTKKMTYPI